MIRFSAVHFALVAFLELLGTACLRAQIETAGEFIVELDASHETAGGEVWENTAPDSNGDFLRFLGQPVLEEVGGVMAVTFNGIDTVYRSEEPAPESIVGPDATRSVEVWAFNPAIDSEESMVSWGRRGGPDGTNMSFNYGTHDEAGAVTHWGGDFDIPWGESGTLVPGAGAWHHLVYTYDGAFGRLYADGCLTDVVDCPLYEVTRVGLDTATPFPINLGAQVRNEANPNDYRNYASLSLARVRVHGDALEPEQVLANYELERGEFEPLCTCQGCPVSDVAFPATTYALGPISFTSSEGEPILALTSPAGATFEDGVLRYEVPADASGSFTVAFECTVGGEMDTIGWEVEVREITPRVIEVADFLVVELDALHSSAGSAVWTNTADDPNGDFTRIGQPVVEQVRGVTALTFNGSDAAPHVYRSEEPAPTGLVGLEATRSVEVWAFNPEIDSEESMVSWGRRGGPDGTNMSFNYGTHDEAGALTHWGGDFDIPWGEGGTGVPEAGAWHHLAYTYDGVVGRLYADGCLTDVVDCAVHEATRPGLDTASPFPINIGAQVRNEANPDDFRRHAALSLARVRVHDGVLTPDQIQFNYDVEFPEFDVGRPCACENCPLEDTAFRGAPYVRLLEFDGVPDPVPTVIAPEGATITPAGRLAYEVPGDLDGDSFTVTVDCANEVGTESFTWEVTLMGLPDPGTVAVAGELLVDLRAEEVSADSPDWTNRGTLADFLMTGGLPVVDEIGNAPAVTFTGSPGEVFQCLEEAPASIVGSGPRSIEVWAFEASPAGIGSEESLVSWGRRGGAPDGSNLSFNYGSGDAGAATHWGGDFDLSWGDALPEAGRWHHLAYTYDGDTARVYADGCLRTECSAAARAVLLSTHGGTPITIGAQIGSDGIGDDKLAALSIGQVRVHDGVLSAEQIVNNFVTESRCYLDGDCIPDRPGFIRADSNGDAAANIADASYLLNRLFLGGPALPCHAAGDSNDDGAVNIADANYLLNFLFLGGPPPRSPYPDCDDAAPGDDCAEPNPVCD